MIGFFLTPQATQDADAIWDYTADRWGEAQAKRYLQAIETCWIQLASGQIKGKKIHSNPAIYSQRCQHHFILYSQKEKIIILAVLHVKMDYLVRLERRLKQ